MPRRGRGLKSSFQALLDENEAHIPPTPSRPREPAKHFPVPERVDLPSSLPCVLSECRSKKDVERHMKGYFVATGSHCDVFRRCESPHYHLKVATERPTQPDRRDHKRYRTLDEREIEAVRALCPSSPLPGLVPAALTLMGSDMTLSMMSADCTLHHAFAPSQFRPDRGDHVEECARQVGRGLEHFHSRGWMHLDLSTNNILVGWRARGALYMICDLGSARQTGDSDRAATTLIFRSPEVVESECSRPIRSDDGQMVRTPTNTPACDVWALGCCLYYMMTGLLVTQPKHSLSAGVYDQNDNSDQGLFMAHVRLLGSDKVRPGPYAAQAKGMKFRPAELPDSTPLRLCLQRYDTRPGDGEAFLRAMERHGGEGGA
jgi:tRNA A-37 threonylcarbamoyl transferase component Bud32